MYKGIDISANQGKVDFTKLVGNIDYIILRCSYGRQKDSQWERNVAECERLGIPYGVYHYDYGLNAEYASNEAELVLSLIKGHTPVMGVWFDMEDADGFKSKNGMPTKAVLTDMCVAFCKKIKAAGYETGVYASLDWFANKLDDTKLKPYRHWVAQWAAKCQYTGTIDMWQYSSKGSVGGINPVDCDYAYTLAPKVDYKATVQKRFRFSNATMAYLSAYSFADELMKRLATTA